MSACGIVHRSNVGLAHCSHDIVGLVAVYVRVIHGPATSFAGVHTFGLFALSTGVFVRFTVALAGLLLGLYIVHRILMGSRHRSQE